MIYLPTNQALFYEMYLFKQTLARRYPQYIIHQRSHILEGVAGGRARAFPFRSPDQKERSPVRQHSSCALFEPFWKIDQQPCGNLKVRTRGLWPPGAASPSSSYLAKDDEIMIPPCANSSLTDDLTRLHRTHLPAWHGTVLPESPSPQVRGIPSHTRFSFPFFLKILFDTEVLRQYSIPRYFSIRETSKRLLVKVVFRTEGGLQDNHVHFLHHRTRRQWVSP